jgi:hypothetical protein
MSSDLGRLESIIRNRICSVCSDRTVDGRCGLDEPASCALFRLFPEVAKAVQETSSDDIGDYVEAIRKNVCSVCERQASDGSCESRQQVQCALDAYLLLVVDAIEEATGKVFDRADLNRGGSPILPALTGI